MFFYYCFFFFFFFFVVLKPCLNIILKFPIDKYRTRRTETMVTCCMQYRASHVSHPSCNATARYSEYNMAVFKIQLCSIFTLFLFFSCLTFVSSYNTGEEVLQYFFCYRVQQYAWLITICLIFRCRCMSIKSDLTLTRTKRTIITRFRSADQKRFICRLQQLF